MLASVLLDFAENYINIRGGDVLAIYNVTVFANLGKVLSMHLLPGRFGVSMDCKLLEGGLHLCHRHWALGHAKIGIYSFIAENIFK